MDKAEEADRSRYGKSRSRAKPRILIVEDNQLQALLLENILSENDEFTIFIRGSVETAETFLASKPRIQLAIIDVGLPDGDGRDLCLRLRQRGFKAPIIMLSVMAEDNDVVRGLEAGANDYVAKPFQASVLSARVRAQLRIREEQASRHRRSRVGTARAELTHSPNRLTVGSAGEIDESLERLEQRLAEVRPPGQGSNRSPGQADWLPLRSTDKQDMLLAIKTMREELRIARPRRATFEVGRQTMAAFSAKLTHWLGKRLDHYGNTVARALGFATAAQVVAWATGMQRELDTALSILSKWLAHWQF